MIFPPISSIASGFSKAGSNEFKAGINIVNSNNGLSSLSLGLSPGQGSLAETGHLPSLDEKNQVSGARKRQEKDRNRKRANGLQSNEGVQDFAFLFSLYSAPNPATTFLEEGEGHGLICILCYC